MRGLYFSIFVFLVGSTVLAVTERADVWPSRPAACRAAAGQVVSYLKVLVGFSRRQVDVRLRDRTDATRAAAVLVEQVLQECGFAILRGVAVPEPKEDGTFEVVSLAITESGTPQCGSIACSVISPPGPTFTARYEPKPWVEDETAYAESAAGDCIFVGESGRCGSRAEAERTAQRVAREKVRIRLSTAVTLSTGRELGQKGAAVLDWRLDVFLADRGGATDVFHQNVSGPHGVLHRCWVLLAVPKADLEALALQVSYDMRRLRYRGFIQIGAFILALLVIRFLAVRLNSATKGYFRTRIRVISFALVVAAAVIAFRFL